MWAFKQEQHLVPLVGVNFCDIFCLLFNTEERHKIHLPRFLKKK